MEGIDYINPYISGNGKKKIKISSNNLRINDSDDSYANIQYNSSQNSENFENNSH